MSPALRRAVFLDRDGVLNRANVKGGKPYPPAGLDELHIFPEVEKALHILRAQGFWLGVVTNQPDVSRGAQRRSTVESIHEILGRALPLDAFYVCYHDDSDACKCRKPKPGLLFAAAAEHKLSLAGSYMIGDRWRDIDCGRAAGCTTILIDRGYAEPLREQPHFLAADLLAAASILCLLEKVADQT